MLTKVKIKNYQSLKDVTIEPGRLTVIVGDSDVGKSAIVRAIKSVLINRAGTDFITHGQQSVGVALAFDDGGAVAWQKAESATYNIIAKGEKLTFTKMGTRVPQEVSDVLKMGEVVVGDEKLNVNVHDQFDQPFLITSTASLRARLLGELSGINILYLAIQEARRREQQSKRTQSIRVSDLEQTKLRLQAFRHLPEVKQGLEAVATEILKARSMDTECSELVQDIAHLDLANGTLSQGKARVAALEKIVKKRPEVEKLLLDMDSLEKDIKSLQQVSERVTVATGQVKINTAELATWQAQLDKFNVCPTCGQKIPKGHWSTHAHV